MIVFNVIMCECLVKYVTRSDFSSFSCYYLMRITMGIAPTGFKETQRIETALKEHIVCLSI